MTDPFLTAVALVLTSEGVFSNDPTDSGGETYYGIARASHPDIPWPPTEAQAIALYESEYWNRCACASLPWIFALPLFDAAVQHSPLRAIQFLQTALGITVDGVIGPHTIAAATAAPAPRGVLASMMADRMIFYTGCPTWLRDRDGWTARVFKVTLAAVESP